MSIAAGSDITAADGKALSEGQFDYATSGGSSNAYTLSPTLNSGAYTAGCRYKFKANFTNTGAATLNVSSLGAKTIKKNGGDDLDSGDIQNGMMVVVVYDGTYMQMVSPIYKLPSSNGVSNIAYNQSSGDQTIAHGLGRTPRRVRITAFHQQGTEMASSHGIWGNSTYACSFVWTIETNARAGSLGTTTSFIVNIQNTAADGSSPSQTATISVDGTNITLHWVKTGTLVATNNIYFMWEAE